MGDDHVEDQAGERAPEHQFDFEIAQGGVLFFALIVAILLDKFAPFAKIGSRALCSTENTVNALRANVDEFRE
jgi:hypothetical protein